LKTTCKIAILENYALFSSGIKSILHSSDGLEVIAEGVSPDDLTLLLQDDNPDIIIINMLHCVNGGIETVKETKKYFPVIPFLLIANNGLADSFNDYQEHGVKGIVYSHESAAALINSIKGICKGIDQFKQDEKSQETPEEKQQLKNYILSDREMEVLKLFCNGLTYKEIGDRLYISPRTVESHKKNILSKLKISSTAEMVRYATRNKLISN
jgi:RNA polymerase sigma factor (sigma-70 family)